MTDIGTGTYTILAQIAGEMLGLPIDRIEVRARRHRLSPRLGIGRIVRRGQRRLGGGARLRRTSSPSSATAAGHRAGRDDASKDGRVDRGQPRGVADSTLLAAAIEATGKIKPGRNCAKLQPGGARGAIRRGRGQRGDGRGARAADARRVRRRADPQCQDGAQPGDRRDDLGDRGYALHEEAVVDTRYGQFVNHDLGRVSCAGARRRAAPSMRISSRISTAGQSDRREGARRARHLAARARRWPMRSTTRAGVRMRDFPMTLDKVLVGLPPV